MIDGITFGLAAAAFLLALVALGAVRIRYESQRRLSHSLVVVTSRLAALGHDLNRAVDRLRHETRITVALGDLSASPDLAAMLSHVAGAAVVATGARAALARAATPDGQLVTGATPEAAGLTGAAAFEWPPEGARAMTFSFLRDPTVPPHLQAVSGVAVPIAESSTAPVGLIVALFDEHEPGSEQRLAELERLAARVAPVVVAALSVRVADEPPTRDPLTGLATRRIFHESLAREVARAQRSRASLAVLVLDVDGFRAVNERIGRPRADDALRTLATCLEAVAPPGAVAGRIGGDEFALVLPGLNRREADVLLAQLRAEYRDRFSLADAAITLSAGAAELAPADDAITLFERAGRALHAPAGPGLHHVGESAQDAGETV